jgi:hypothetical protein
MTQQTLDLDQTFAELVADIEPLESLEAAWDWGAFGQGVLVGVWGGTGLSLIGVGIGLCIT